jgi:hypothetical protein
MVFNAETAEDAEDNQADPAWWISEGRGFSRAERPGTMLGFSP